LLIVCTLNASGVYSSSRVSRCLTSAAPREWLFVESIWPREMWNRLCKSGAIPITAWIVCLTERTVLAVDVTKVNLLPNVFSSAYGILTKMMNGALAP
jgi:hypothetical protein